MSDNNNSVKIVRVFELKGGQLTSNIISFQYYPTRVGQAKMKYLVPEVKKQLKCPENIWIYGLDATPTEKRLYFLGNSSIKPNFGLLTLFVETERALEDHELTSVIQKPRENYTLEIAKKDCYDKKDVESFTTYKKELGKELNDIMKDAGIKKGDLKDLDTQKCPVCCKCGINVGDVSKAHKHGVIWFVIKDTLEPMCIEDADTLVHNNVMDSRELFMVCRDPVFKFEDEFTELKKTYIDVPDDRIRCLLWLNRGNKDNVKAVLGNDDYKMGYKPKG